MTGALIGEHCVVCGLPQQTYARSFCSEALNGIRILAIVAARTGVLSRGRAEVLETLFFEEQLDVVTIQESRVRSPCVREGPFYIMHSAAATLAGLYGNQFWIRRDAGILVLSVVANHPRAMAVHLDIGGHRVWVLSVHAPSAHVEEGQCREIWDAIEVLMGLAVRGDRRA